MAPRGQSVSVGGFEPDRSYYCFEDFEAVLLLAWISLVRNPG